MSHSRGVVWNEKERRFDDCWLCEAWHTPTTYKFLRTVKGNPANRGDLLEMSAMDILCQKCGGRLCTGPHHGTKPCKARQLAMKMCREGWVSVRRYAHTTSNGRNETMATSARVCERILKMFEHPSKVVMSRYAGTVGPECWTNDEGREFLLFLQLTARVLGFNNPAMARAFEAKPDALKDYRAVYHLGASPASLARLLDLQFNRGKKGNRRHLSRNTLVDRIIWDRRYG